MIFVVFVFFVAIFLWLRRCRAGSFVVQPCVVVLVPLWFNPVLQWIGISRVVMGSLKFHRDPIQENHRGVDRILDLSVVRPRRIDGCAIVEP